MKYQTNSCILITGSSGVIGTALAAELRSNDPRQIVTVSSRDVNLIDFDATVAFLQQCRPEIVYHLAARVSGIMGNMKEQGRAYLDNTLINTNVIEAARLAGVRKIIAMGAAAIYSDQAVVPMREEDIWLGRPHPSEAGYAHAKLGMLAQLESYHQQYGLDFAYCVSTNLFGQNDRFDEQNGHVLPSLISKFHRAVQIGEAVTVWGSGAPLRDFLYSKDAARAMRLIADQFTGTINLATGRSVSIKEAVEALQLVVGGGVKVKWDLTKPDGQRLRAYDISKLYSIGFQPSFTFVEALRETYEWYNANSNIVRR